jgi:hypothetical protein
MDIVSDLSKEMYLIADKGHPLADELRAKAKAFEEATAGYYSSPQTVNLKKFMACWARARRAWSEATGKPLVGSPGQK